MLINSNSTLYCLEIPELQKSQYKKWGQLLPLDRKRRIEIAPAFQRPLLAYSDLFVRYLASATLNISADKIAFDNGAYGKPYIVGFPTFQYNVSHSENLFVVFVSNRSVGVDVEKIKSPNIQIANRFFTENEKNYVFSDPALTIKRFYEIWTRKEAYVKYLGKGLSHPLLSFDVLKDIGDNFYTFELDKYIISAFSGNKVASPYPITTITEDELIMALSSVNQTQKVKQ